MADNINQVGEVTHYYDQLGVAIVMLKAPLKVGDKVQFKGHAADFTQEIKQMQLNHQDIQAGGRNQEVGVKVDQRAREGDLVYLVS